MSNVKPWSNVRTSQTRAQISSPYWLQVYFTLKMYFSLRDLKQLDLGNQSLITLCSFIIECGLENQLLGYDTWDVSNLTFREKVNISNSLLKDDDKTYFKMNFFVQVTEYSSAGKRISISSIEECQADQVTIQIIFTKCILFWRCVCWERGGVIIPKLAGGAKSLLLMKVI